MPVLEHKSFLGGISTHNDRGIRGSFKFGSNLDIRKVNDTLSCGQALKEDGLFGTSHSQSSSLSPSPSVSPSGSVSSSPSSSNSPSRSSSPSGSASRSASASLSPSASQSPSSSRSASPSASAGLNNVYEDLVLFWVKATDGNTYGFGDEGHIYRRYSDGFTRMVYTDSRGKIKGAIEKPSSDGKTYLQWATDTQIKRKELPGASTWNDVTEIADNLTGSEWHTMKQIGGANYVANGSKLALVGYDDSWTNEALNVIPGNQIKTIIERNGRAVLGTYKTGYPNKGINGAIDTEYPLIQRGDDGELYYADFTNTIPVRRFPGGGRVNPGGVANEIDQVDVFDWVFGADSWVDKQSIGNMSLWGVFSAGAGTNGVYSFGRKHKDQPFTLNLEYEMDVDEIGAIITVDGTTLISYRNGSSVGVKAVDLDNKAIATWESLEFRSPIKKAEQPTYYSHVELFMDELPAGCRVGLSYKRNKSDDWITAYTGNGDSVFSTQGAKKATFRITAEMDIYELQVTLTPNGNNAPEIHRIRTYFN